MQTGQIVNQDALQGHACTRRGVITQGEYVTHSANAEHSFSTTLHSARAEHAANMHVNC